MQAQADRDDDQTWIGRCLPGLRALLLRLTRNVDATSDLCQDVVLAVFKAMREQRIRDPAALTAYIHQTARHAAAAHARGKRLEYVADIPEGEGAWSDAGLTPPEAYEERELQSLAHTVMDELPTDRDRGLILGFYVEGKTKPELMREFDLTSRHFDRVIFRARSRMRELLARKLSDERFIAQDRGVVAPITGDGGAAQ